MRQPRQHTESQDAAQTGTQTATETTTAREEAHPMRIYIPAARRAAKMALRRGSTADMARISAIDAAHQAAAEALYTAIMDGTAAEAHQRHTGGQLLTIYHRSTRPGVIIQASTFYRDRSGSWTASSHHNINRPEDIELHPGQYLTITKGA